MTFTYDRDGVLFIALCMAFSGFFCFWIGYYTAWSDTKCPRVDDTKVVSSSYNRATGEDSCVYNPTFARNTFRLTWKHKS
jgi:hypothetical protein